MYRSEESEGPTQVQTRGGVEGEDACPLDQGFSARAARKKRRLIADKPRMRPRSGTNQPWDIDERYRSDLELLHNETAWASRHSARKALLPLESSPMQRSHGVDNSRITLQFNQNVVTRFRSFTSDWQFPILAIAALRQRLSCSHKNRFHWNPSGRDFYLRRTTDWRAQKGIASWSLPMMESLRRHLNMHSERRRSPRYPFFASAEIVEVRTGIRLTGRTNELSRNGCYFDMMNPLPAGSRVEIRIVNQEQTFEAKGHVVYSQSNMGMGVTFDQIGVSHRLMLESWLGTLRGD